MSCYSATVSCPEVPDIGVTFGTYPGTAGTIVFLNGSGDTLPGGTGELNTYEKSGFGVAQFAFSSDWEGGAADILTAACRPATMLNYFYTPASNTPYCAEGVSAGSSIMGYALAWYGLDSEFDNVEMSVGPVFSNLVQGCAVPKAPPVTVVPTNGAAFNDSPLYVGGEINSLTSWTGQQCLPSSGSSEAENASWAAQSLVQPSATFTYPNTSLAGWVCDNGLNPSAAQAYLFFSQVTSPWTLTRLSGCTGAEGIQTGITPQGATAASAIQGDMLAHCIKHHPK